MGRVCVDLAMHARLFGKSRVVAGSPTMPGDDENAIWKLRAIQYTLTFHPFLSLFSTYFQ